MVRPQSDRERAKLSFTLVDCLLFLILLFGFVFIVVALFTSNWLEEKWEFRLELKWPLEGKIELAYHRTHGLYRICTKKFLDGKQVIGLSRFVKNQGPWTEINDGRYECMNRFDRDDFTTGYDIVDRFIRSYYSRAINWEIGCLTLISLSAVLNLNTMVSFVFVRQRCPILPALVMTVAFACSLTAVILFSAYHKGTDILRDKLLKSFMTETSQYQYSFWLAITGCCCQIVASTFLFLLVVYQCWNICHTDYTAGHPS